MNSTFDYLPGLSLHPSDDLVTRWQMGHAIQDPGQFDFRAVPDSRGSSAPTIRCHDGTFSIACALMDAGEVTGNFSVTATDIAGPWSSPAMLPDARTRPRARQAGGRGIRHLDAHYGPGGLG